MEEDEEALQKELREAFRLYDKEGNGFIPTTCLREILRELDDQLTDTDLDMMIEEIDSDGSGTVDFDGEFVWSARFSLPPRLDGPRSMNREQDPFSVQCSVESFSMSTVQAQSRSAAMVALRRLVSTWNK